MDMKPKARLLVDPWGDSDLMALCAMRYCMGRRTYIVGMCVDFLIKNWKHFSQKTKDLIQRDLEDEFIRDERDRKTEATYFALGHDCDKKEWERVRDLWRKSAENRVA